MKKIVICFPGIGYHCDKPLLYYGDSVAGECGYDEMRKLNYSFAGGNIRGNYEKMKEAYEALFAQAKEQLADVEWDGYDEILFLSKSIGTIIATSYAKALGLKQVKHVLYTPLVQTFDFAPEKGIAFIGSSDPWSKLDDVVKLAREKQIPLHIYEGCNNSLESGDTAKNLDVLQDVMKKTRGFLHE